MDKLDYIVVGFGIAGASLCELLLQHQKRFVVIDHSKQGATRTAGGTLNPVALKRFLPAWNASVYMDQVVPFYQALEHRLGASFLKEMPILRIFTSVEEQNNWMVASDKQELSPFMLSSVVSDKKIPVESPFGFGKVRHAYRLDTNALLNAFENYLQKKDSFKKESFDHSKLVLSGEGVSYKGIEAKRIVFAEGTAAMHNPLFPKELLIPKKGEYLIVHAPELPSDIVLKGRFFIIPLGGGYVKVGATFAHGDTSWDTTEKSRQEVETELQKLLKTSYTVTHQEVGMRPTVKDRRPIVGKLRPHEPVFCFNGLGTRGLFIAPWIAAHLYGFMEHGLPLPEEMDINRFSV